MIDFVAVALEVVPRRILADAKTVTTEVAAVPGARESYIWMRIRADCVSGDDQIGVGRPLPVILDLVQVRKGEKLLFDCFATIFCGEVEQWHPKSHEY